MDPTEKNDKIDFWKAADFFRTRGAEHMGESMLNVGRSGRFKKGGCRWSIMYDLTVGGDGTGDARVLVWQETTPDWDGTADDPIAVEKERADAMAMELRRRGYDGEFRDEGCEVPGLGLSDREARICRFNGRFDKEIKTIQGLEEEWRLFAAPDLAVAFGLVPVGEFDTIATVQKVVAAAYSVDVEDLQSKRSPSALQLPRQVAMHLSIELGMKNAIEVAGHFGPTRQMEVVRARKAVRQLASADAAFARKLQEISRQVEKSLSGLV